MNKKAQLSVGMLLLVFIGIVVCLVLINPIASNIGSASQTVFVKNVTITPGAGAGSIVELTGQEIIGTPQVNNASGAAISINPGNYTITECVRTSDGVKGICYTRLIADASITKVNVSYTYGPIGYVDDTGSQAIIGLILIFAVLAIAIWVLVPVIKEKVGW